MKKRNDDEQEYSKDHCHRLLVKKVTSKIYQLFISEFTSLDHELDDIINKISSADENDQIEIHISSTGGFIFDLFKMENIIHQYFYGRAKTILNSYGYSAGALLFLTGDERIIYENSELMFHNLKTGYYGKLKDIDRHLAHEKKHWENYIRRSLKPYFTKQEIEELLLGKEFWLDATEICQRGICTGVSIFGTIMSPDLYVDYSKNKKSKDELIRQLKNVKDNLSKKDRDFIDSVSTKNPD